MDTFVIHVNTTLIQILNNVNRETFHNVIQHGVQLSVLGTCWPLRHRSVFLCIPFETLTESGVYKYLILSFQSVAEKADTERAGNHHKKPENSKDPNAQTGSTPVSVGWSHDGDLVSKARGGGSLTVNLSGKEGFQDVLDVVKRQYMTEHEVVGLKVGRATSETISSFREGIRSVGEFCKKNKLFMSKIKIYLITQSDQPKCTCHTTEPDFQISFMLNGEVTCYDKRSALQHVALHKPEIRDMQANPLSEGFELKQMIKCKKCQVTYLDWEVDGADRVAYTYGQKKAHKGIIHGPETLHGNHFGSFVAILVANHDAKHSVKWWRDGSLFAEGDGLYIIWPDQSGTF